MKVWQGHSERADAASAVEEATSGWPGDARPHFVLAYASTKQDLGEVRAALRARYPDAELAGCSTSGEHTTGRHHRGALALTAVGGDDLRVATAFAGDLGGFDQARADAIAGGLFEALGLSRDELDLGRTFCLMLIDGLSLREEQVAAWMAEALDGVPLLGGSAGDDLNFRRTDVMATRGVGPAAAAFVLGHSRVPTRVFKHQHFRPTPRSLAITRADVSQRRVYEMDGYPAAEAYARSLGLAGASEVTPEVVLRNPLVFQSHGQGYVRSIQKVEPDGAMVFYCGVEEGMVLDVACHDDIVGALEGDLGRALGGLGRPRLVLGMNCILRAIEAEQGGRHEALSRIVARHADCFAAFDTYGEQLDGLHINQTFVGIAFGRQG